MKSKTIRNMIFLVLLTVSYGVHCFSITVVNKRRTKAEVWLLEIGPDVDPGAGEDTLWPCGEEYDGTPYRSKVHHLILGPKEKKELKTGCCIRYYSYDYRKDWKKLWVPKCRGKFKIK